MPPYTELKHEQVCRIKVLSPLQHISIHNKSFYFLGFKIPQLNHNISKTNDFHFFRFSSAFDCFFSQLLQFFFSLALEALEFLQDEVFLVLTLPYNNFQLQKSFQQLPKQYKSIKVEANV